jgi:hypothetical protein
MLWIKLAWIGAFLGRKVAFKKVFNKKYGSSPTNYRNFASDIPKRVFSSLKTYFTPGLKPG